MSNTPSRRRRFGDRKDGWMLRGQEPLNKIIPYFMSPRSASINYFRDRLDIDKVEEYIRNQREEGLKGLGLMHILIASYIRMLSQRPALNRFIAGQKVFARNNIEIMFNIKKTMTLDAPETVLKMVFEPDATIFDVYNTVAATVDDYRSKPQNGVDSVSAFMASLPGPILKFVVWLLKLLDYFGKLPTDLVKTSPFHGSLYITSMGSLGIPPVMHHLYEFGNVPLFLSFGAKQREKVLDSDGSLREVRYVDICLSSDERICDGYYFASAYKQIRRIMRNPAVLETKPDVIMPDHEIDRRR